MLDQIVVAHHLAVHEVDSVKGVLRISKASTAVTATSFSGTAIAVAFDDTPRDAVKIRDGARIRIVR